MAVQYNEVTIYDDFTGVFLMVELLMPSVDHHTVRHWVACEGFQPCHKPCPQCVVTLNCNFSFASSPPPICVLYLYENCSEKG